MGVDVGDKKKGGLALQPDRRTKISIRPLGIPLILFLIMIESSDTTEWQLTHCSPRLISLSFVPSLVPHQPHTQYGSSPILSKTLHSCSPPLRRTKTSSTLPPCSLCSALSASWRILYVFPKLPTFRMFAYERVARLSTFTNDDICMAVFS